MSQYLLKGLDRHSEYVTVCCMSQDLATLQHIRDGMEKKNPDYIYIISSIEEVPTNGHYCPLHINDHGICQICGKIL